MKRKALICVLFITLPTVIYLYKSKKVDPDVIQEQLHQMLDDVSFISIDYTPKKAKLVGIDRDIYEGVVHTNRDESVVKYKFIADVKTGEIIEITSL